MKTLINKCLIFFVASLALMSCEKDEDIITIKTEGTPELSASTSSVVLVQESGDNDALTLTWSPLDMTWSNPDVAHDAVKYTIELAPAGSDFETKTEVAVTGATSKTFTVKELNALLTRLEFPVSTPTDVELRVRTEYASNVAPVYSNVTTVTASTYLDIPFYPSLWIPGQYQGWAPDAAPRISSSKDDGKYEGYVYMSVADGFKFTSDPDWSHTNYGSGGAGKLSTDGGAGNLTITEPGYYLLKANTNDLTWSATKTTWGVIGDATGSWEVDQNLTYDETEKVWKATLTLSVGEIKFRANDGWDINLGDEKDDRPADGILEYGTDNIKIEEAGTYEVILDLSNPAFYMYKLKKQ